jgi:DNA invertase Pin-like site-specific DNA recombinase
MRIALLSRVSTSKQENENQLLQLRAFAVTRGWKIIFEFVDSVTGSGKKTREQFDAMMLAASQHRFDLVLFWSLDRFSREGALATLQHLQRLSGYGVGWRSFTEQYLDSTGPFADAIVGFLATIARQERITISERTKAGLERTRRAGTKLGRPGVNVDMEAVRMRQANGHSLRTIARSLACSPALLCKKMKMAAVAMTL